MKKKNVVIGTIGAAAAASATYLCSRAHCDRKKYVQDAKKEKVGLNIQ